MTATGAPGHLASAGAIMNVVVASAVAEPADGLVLGQMAAEATLIRRAPR